MHTRSKGPVVVYQEPITRTPIGQTIKGKLSENQDAAHILSFEILNNVISNNKINKLKSTDDVIREMNKDINLVLKSQKENRIDDRRLDYKIKKAMNKSKFVKKPEVIDRIKKQYEIINKLNFPIELKNQLKITYEKLKDKNDKFICKSEKNGEIESVKYNKDLILEKYDENEDVFKLHAKLLGNIKNRQIERQKGFIIAAASRSQTSAINFVKRKEINEVENCKEIETEIKEKRINKAAKTEFQASKTQLVKPIVAKSKLPIQEKLKQEKIDKYFEESKVLDEKICIKSSQAKANLNAQPSVKPQKKPEEKVSGKKFYKGGQFIPGGGRAPKGGIWI